MELFDLIDGLPLLPGSEFFYLIDDNRDGVMVKQGAADNSSLLFDRKLFNFLAYKPSPNSSSFIEENYGKWHKINDTFEDLRSVKVTSCRRRNLRGAELRASLVVTNNETLKHLDDYL